MKYSKEMTVTVCQVRVTWSAGGEVIDVDDEAWTGAHSDGGESRVALVGDAIPLGPVVDAVEVMVP